MKLRNILKGGVMLAGLAVYAAILPTAHAGALQSPDSDTLNAAYQVIQFDLKECQALTPKPGVTSNGTGMVSPDILKVSARICNDARGYKPTLEELAKANDFELPADLPYAMNARYA